MSGNEQDDERNRRAARREAITAAAGGDDGIERSVANHDDDDIENEVDPTGFVTPARTPAPSTVGRTRGQDGTPRLTTTQQRQRDKMAAVVDEAVKLGPYRLQQFANVIKDLENARVFAVVDKTVSAARAGIEDLVVKCLSVADKLERDYPGTCPGATELIRELLADYESIRSYVCLLLPVLST